MWKLMQRSIFFLRNIVYNFQRTSNLPNITIKIHQMFLKQRNAVPAATELEKPQVSLIYLFLSFFLDKCWQ
jgi:hypothetical protein